MEKFEKKEITKKSDNLSSWRTDVILKAELADYSPVKGCMVIRPYGYALWEEMQKRLDREIKKAGVENAYFPLFIPYSFLEKEKEHVEGFSPELAIVTIGGGEKLKEKLVVRPTSETIMYSMFSRWIQSWRDLPLKINQWCNIVRWEKRTYLFLRTTEFLWQEGHTAHATHSEAQTEVERALKMYIKFLQESLAIPGLGGKKSQFDKFPGAVDTFAYEALMPDGKALQICTSHDLGQNFSKVFNINFQDEKGNSKNVWQTSWGLTTRAIGGLVMAHGDNQGLIMPPKVAPIQVVIVPIFSSSSEENTAIVKHCKKLKKRLEQGGIRVKFDDRKEQTPGYKFNEWELKGVPLRIEVGEKEMQADKVALKLRYPSATTPLNGSVPFRNLNEEVVKRLEWTQEKLLEKAKDFLKERTYKVDSYGEFKEIMKGSKKGFIEAFWCEDEKCERKIKKETKASTRCLPLGARKEKGKCIYCHQKASYRWVFAQAY